jgi:rubrerythrin
MGLAFNADEIFEIAQQIERNGAKFYRRAAEGFKDKRLKGLVGELASMEDKHLELFTTMRENIADAGKTPTVFDPEGEAALYLAAMADARIFDVKVDPSSKLTGRESVSDVLRIAIGLEKDSVVFYLGMRDLVPPKFGRGQIEQIINEEMRHVTILSRELAKAS